MAENTLSRLKGLKPVKAPVESVASAKAQVELPVKSEEVRAVERVVVAEDIVPVEKTKARPSKEAIARRNRRTRSPIDGRRNIMTVKGLAPGMLGRWVDNTPERVEELLEQGYDIVREKVQVGDLSADSSRRQMGEVTTKRVGGGKEQILMQIPKEWWEADQREKQKIVDAREAAIHGASKAPGVYGKVEIADVVPGKRPTPRLQPQEEE